MNGFNKFLAKSFLSGAMLFTGVAQAMQIPQFDKIADSDQNEYVADLVQGAEKLLVADGKADQAQKVSQLFTTNLGTDKVSVGMVEFLSNLDRFRVFDADRVAKDPDVARLEVEHAMIAT
jgi:hypothetical protein